MGSETPSRSEELARTIGSIGHRAQEMAVAAFEDPSRRTVFAGEAEALDARLRAATDELGLIDPEQARRMSRCGSEAFLDLLYAKREERMVSLRLGRHMRDAFSATGKRVVAALAKIGPPAVDVLLQVLQPKSSDGEWAASAEAVAGLDDSGRLDPFVRYLGIHSRGIRAWAAEALGCIRDSRAIGCLVAALADEEYDTQRAAMVALRELGGPAVDPLIGILQDGQSSVRESAAEVLGWIRNPRAREPLIRVLADGEPKVRCAALRALGSLGDPGLAERIGPALRDADSAVREHAAAALGKVGGGRALELLTPAYEDADADVRWSVVRALQGLGAAAVPVLVRALADPGYPGIRSDAAKFLGEIADRRAVEPLLTALCDPSDIVREHAARALAAIGDPAAVEPLIRALADETREVRSQAVRSLGELRDPRAVEPLVGMFTDEDEYLRDCAAEALASIGDRASFEPLVRMMGDESSDVRRTVAAALRAVGGTDAVPHLVRALGDPDSGVRWQAASALADLADARAAEPLKTALSDPDRNVRNEVARALARVAEIGKIRD